MFASSSYHYCWRPSRHHMWVNTVDISSRFAHSIQISLLRSTTIVWHLQNDSSLLLIRSFEIRTELKEHSSYSLVLEADYSLSDTVVLPANGSNLLYRSPEFLGGL